MGSRTTMLEQFFMLLLGFLLFQIIFIRIGFIFGLPINYYTLPISWLIFVALVFFISSEKSSSLGKYQKLLPLGSFIGISILFYGVSLLMSYTFDTSWDGQGYNQTAVIALAKGWNPARQAKIDLGMEELPSQIFAEGYPSALWELQASVYAFVGRINAAKILNVLIGVLAGISMYSLMRKLRQKKIFSLVVSILTVLQPIYLIQLLTFMQDGFLFQLLIMAMATLIVYILNPKSTWAMMGFVGAELLLVSTKYSQLPIALALAVVFGLLLGNRILNREYNLHPGRLPYVIGFIFVVGLFAYIPYGKNVLFHGTPFYPVNVPELMGSVRFNNVPPKLLEVSKTELLFYGIFSQSQTFASGDPRSPDNIAQLKIPFTFNLQEIKEGAMIYNNRVGAGGVLFSGIVVLSLVLLIYSSFIVQNQQERYALYVSYFCLVAVLVVSLFAPTPNLLRYVNQLQLIPFFVVLPLFVHLKYKSVSYLSYLILGCVFVNTALFTGAVMVKAVDENRQVNNQLDLMREADGVYNVRAQHFYSNYVMLSEHDVNYVAVENLTCNVWGNLWASSMSTQYCLK